ncbi:hypothetical protein [Caenispirillum salinarum]|uniref:hypothetical protein n=1 Tax=Caenispirillum salinarum TaxID=859058 RepID=UPI00384CD4CB
METGILILAMGAVGFVMYWLVMNDGAPSIRDQKGLLRMVPPKDETARDEAAARERAATVKRRFDD